MVSYQQLHPQHQCEALQLWHCEFWCQTIFSALAILSLTLFFTALNVTQMNGNKEGVIPTKMNTWDKSTNSANRIDLSAV